MPDSPNDRPRLGDQHYGLTDAAVRAYADHERCSMEAARADLELHIGEARQSESDPRKWRLRSRTIGLDLSIVTDRHHTDGHLVVKALSVRPYEQSTTRPPSYERRQLRRAAERETVSASGRAAPLRSAASSDANPAPRASARPDARPGVEVPLTLDERNAIVAELRDGETVADVLRNSGLATARARARARRARSEP